MGEKQVKETAEKSEKKFSKKRIIASEIYKANRDLLNVLLDDGKEYTKTEVNKVIDGYLKKEVK
jgi:hypothetical protein